MTAPKIIPLVGDVLIHKFRRTTGEVEATVLSVVKGSNRITVTVNVGGEKYPSLSSAAAAVAGHPQNGWTYWGLKKQIPSKRKQ